LPHTTFTLLGPCFKTGGAWKAATDSVLQILTHYNRALLQKSDIKCCRTPPNRSLDSLLLHPAKPKVPQSHGIVPCPNLHTKKIKVALK